MSADAPAPLSPDTADAPAAPARQLLLFKLDGRLHAMELEAVREVIPSRRPTRMPGAPAHVAGLINVRGTIVTVIDLATRLNGGRAAPSGSTILVEHAGKLVGVAVDEVVEVRELPADAIEPAADAGQGAAVSALGRLADSVVIIIDIRSVIAQVMA